MTLAKADAKATASGTIAMATEDITENQFGYFTAFGLARDVDTSAFTTGDQLYLSHTVAGGYTNVKPPAPYYIIKIGIVIRVHATEGSIFVSISQISSSACDVVRNYITPTTQTVTAGTLTSGTVSDVQTWQDGNEVHIDEAAGVPGFNIEYTFENVAEFCEILVTFHYVGATTHNCVIEIYDDTNSVWKEFFSQNGAPLNHNTRFSPFPDIANVANYINASDQVIMRFYHPVSGNASHDLYIDYVAIIGSTI